MRSSKKMLDALAMLNVNEAKGSAKEAADRSPIFIEHTSEYLNVHLPELRRSAGTAAAERSTLSIFVRYVRQVLRKDITKFRMRECTAELVAGWLKYEMDVNKISASSRNRHLASFKNYVFYVGEKDPTVMATYLDLCHISYAKTEKPVRPVLTPEQVIAIIQAAKMGNKGERNSVLLLLLYETAVRVSELVTLKRSDIAAAGPSPHIIVKGKGKKSRRINLNTELAQIMKDYLAQFHSYTAEDAPLFYSISRGRPQELTTRSVEFIVSNSATAAREIQIMQNADNLIPERVHPHMFRRSKATALLNQDTNMMIISAFLGHASTVTTQKYAKYSDKQIAEAIENTPVLDIKDDGQALAKNDVEALLKLSALTP